MFTLTSDKHFEQLAVGQAFYMPGNAVFRYYKLSATECGTSPTNWAMRFKLPGLTAVWVID